MFEWFFGNRYKKIEEKTERGFSVVKKDIESVGKWIKHLDGRDKQVFDSLDSIKLEIATIKEELARVSEVIKTLEEGSLNKQVFENLPVLPKQTDVQGVDNLVQTGVQTGKFYDILKVLSSNERLLVFTLLNSELKLSYEDLALLLGKERSTIRGQINAIKQKSESLIEEITEKNGKKRVFIPEEIKEKLAKYAKVRVGLRKKVRVNERNEERSGES